VRCRPFFRLGKEGIREGFDSTLVVDAADNLLEAAHANIFLRMQDGWATPEADGGLLPGTVRQRLLEHAPVPIRQQKIPMSALAGVKEAFLTNSNAGIVPVTRIDDNHYPIGEETRNLVRWLHPPWAT
jgi:branched-subunit amino acid aminotransferase/4-amino-4-deoxychorismate lyase